MALIPTRRRASDGSRDLTTLPHSAGRAPARPRIASSDTLLERLKKLHPQSIDLSLGRIERLLAALGHPEQKLPPVRACRRHQRQGLVPRLPRAIAEALGKGVHVYTSPHLVNFHERIVLAGPHGSSRSARTIWSIASPAPKPPMAAS